MLDKIDKFLLPDEDIGANIVYVNGQSFFLSKIDSFDWTNNKFWWAYNYDTRNKIMGRKCKHELIYLLCEVYPKYKDKDI